MLLSTGLSAQDNPLIWRIPSTEYQLEGEDISPQIREFVQLENGQMLMASTTGILLFDGRTWSVLPGTQGYRFRMKKGNDGYIYAAHDNDIGKIYSDENGRFTYYSLLDSFPESRPQSAIYDLVRTDHHVHFLTEQFIYSWHTELNRLMVRFSPGKILSAIASGDGESLMLLLENGLYKSGEFTGEWITRMPVDAREISAFFSLDNRDEKFLVFTVEEGIFEYGLGGRKPYQFSTNQNGTTDLIVFDAIQVNDGNFAIATNDQGLFLLNHQKRTLQPFSNSYQIPNQPINELFQDRESGLWLAGDNYIFRFPYPLPIRLYGESEGIAGVVTASRKFENKLYVGTTQGLYMTDNPDAAELSYEHRASGIVRGVWDLHVGEEGLWIAASSGLFLLRDGQLQRIISDQITMSVRESRHHPDLVVVGTDEGIGRLIKKGNDWIWEGILPGFDGRIESLAELNERSWWGSYKELVRIDGLGEGTEISFIPYREEQGWKPAMKVIDLTVEGKGVFAGTAMGRFEVDPVDDRLNPVTPWNLALPERYQESNLVTPLTDSSWWVFNGGYPGKMLHTDTGFVWQNDLYSGLRTDIWSVFLEENGQLWLGTNEGLARYLPQQDSIPRLAVQAYFTDIQIQRDSLIFIPKDPTATLPQFPHGGSDLFFTYSAPGFTFPGLFEFQFKLDGYDKDWSEWSRYTEREKYTRLSEGRYTFRVRAKNLFGEISPDATYSFVILPPWYRSWWAYLLYVAILILGIAGLIQYRTRVERKRLAVKEAQLARERQTTERLRAVDKLKDQFLANTSHELKTPLNGIIGLAESLFFKEERSEYRHNLGLIVSSGKRLQSLVDDILDFSRLKSSDLSLHQKAIDIRAISSVVLDLQTPLVKGKQVSLLNALPEDFPIIAADEGRITQILHNLIGNGIKFTEEGSVRIHGEWTDESVTIHITDTGIGIPEGKLQRIFRAFEQADGSIQRQYAGTGLGLTISRQLVELHGGTLDVVSEQGKGSTFSFTIPRTDLATIDDSGPRPAGEFLFREEPELADSTFSPSSGETIFLPDIQDPLKILVVDDEEINLEVIKAHLSSPGLEVILAMNGQAALALLEQEDDFDLVLLDVMMPGMSGFEVCREIRKKYLPSELPVIIITAKNQIEDLVQAFSIGANDYIAKPFSRAEFISRVKTQLHLQTIHAATQKFVPREFLKALGYEAITETKYGDQIQKTGTILFTDMRNYTTIAEQLSPEETFLFLNAYYSRMGPIISQEKGFINQFVGDGIMALFLESTDDALRAGIGMQKALMSYNVERQARGFMPITVGMGMHTGELMLGIIGDGLRMDAGLVSDTVNTASRIEGMTKFTGSSMLISDTTYQGLEKPEEFTIRFLGRVNVKGREKATGIYECLDDLPEELLALRRNSISKVAEAFSLVENQQFEEAVAIYAEIVRKDPEDQAVRFILQEVMKQSQRELPEPWTGSLELNSK